MNFIKKLLPGFNKEPIPDNWLWIEELWKKIPDKRATLSEVPFYVIDLELTGLDPDLDRIVSLSAIPVQGSQIYTDRMMSLYIEQDFFRQESIAIHEILPGENHHSPISETVALQQFMKFAGAGVWVFHGAELDFRFLKAAANRSGLPALKNRPLDTLKMLPRALDFYRYPGQLPTGTLKLDQVCKKLNIPHADNHTADGDALATAILFTELLSKLRKRGIEKLGELMKGSDGIFRF